jgi:hypothetical protein
MPIITALGKLRQEDHKFKDSLSYIGKPCLKNTPKTLRRLKQEDSKFESRLGS